MVRNRDVKRYDPRIHDRNGTNICFRCGVVFVEGDEIIIRPRLKYYHKECFYAEGIGDAEKG